jgi:flagellar biosynthetic protein FlhB
LPQEDQESRTEKATSKRRGEARNKGQVARSQEIGNVILLLAALLFFKWFGGYFMDRLMVFTQVILENFHRYDVSDVNIQHLFLSTMYTVAQALWPLMLVLMVVGLASNIAQVGFQITTEPLTPKFDKFNPISGIKKLFSVRSLVELAKAIVKILIVGLVGYVTIKNRYADFVPLMDMDVGQIFYFIRHVVFVLIFRIVLVLLILAALDYAYQRYDYEKNLKMTKQEIKDERKQAEGDPQIKARIRRTQLEFARRRMMEAVPEAAVVITNPVHLALALKYEEDDMDAPQVVAKGQRLLAERIKEIARDHDIPVIENRELAQALYPTVEVGDFIPEQFYRAVAEVLSYVYRLKETRVA